MADNFLSLNFYTSTKCTSDFDKRIKTKTPVKPRNGISTYYSSQGPYWAIFEINSYIKYTVTADYIITVTSVTFTQSIVSISISLIMSTSLSAV